MSSGILTSVNPALVDILVDPQGRPLRGCHPRNWKVGSRLPLFEDAFFSTLRDYPRSDWDDLVKDNVSLELLIRWIHNQLQEGTCASNAMDLVYEVCMAMCVGIRNAIKQSPIAVYRWIASGPGTGSNIMDNVEQITKIGSLPEDTPENRAFLKLMGLPESHVLKHTGYYQAFPSGWQETAKHFTVTEAYEVNSFEGAVTGLMNDFALIYGRAGHAICGVTFVKINGVWHIKYGNSWGLWGEKGENGLQMFGYDSESFVRNAIGSYGACLVRSVRVSDLYLKAIMELQLATAA